ncbi:helix-turn-helix transcriptional regulator [Streptomyces sp. PT12]|uniref:ArsR/SmtB family transcription factor n=1 Tax=Streptomyces sp. PT12 TaxID=1510197 RepID=UPI00215D3595|nr:helix-turn-helix domain-containing protein [Streptomyces sp. PT12]
MDQVPPVDQETANFLKALASETRWGCLPLAGERDDAVRRRRGTHRQRGRRPQRPGLSTASEHLALLRRSGLLRAERDGRQVRYRADGTRTTQRLDALKGYLTGCCPPD